MSPQRLADHHHLFKLDWQRDPSQLRRRQGTDHLTVETAAWLAEINEQLVELACSHDINLVLMGGNAAALRMDVSKQRGSRDNDYLTDACAQDIEALIDDFTSRFSALSPLFVPKLHIPHAAKALPLRTYYIPVPAVYAPSRTDKHPIKVEFHINIEHMPPSETITRPHFALSHPVSAIVPKVPYQVALKLMTLVHAPVGLDVAREDALPRQVYDLDELMQSIESAGDWAQILTFTHSLYDKERRAHGFAVEEGEPWLSIDRSLGRWALVDSDRNLSAAVNAFQTTQMSTAARSSMSAWRARFRRLQVAVCCASMGSDGYAIWRTSLELESQIPQHVKGKAQLSLYRNPIAKLTGVPAGRHTPRVHLWEGLAARSSELSSVVSELETGLL